MPKISKTESVSAKVPTREPKWTPRRIAVVKALRSLHAINAASARTAGDIGKKAGTVEGINLSADTDKVKLILDIYKTNELLHNGFAASVRNEGERELRYYLTAKGQKTSFPQPEKKEKSVKEKK